MNIIFQLLDIGRLRAVPMLLVLSTIAWNAFAEPQLIQQIGNLSGETADAVLTEVTVVPFSPSIDAKTTPILLARGKAFVHERRRGHRLVKRVRGLRPAEKKAIRQAYRAGQTIVVLDASTHDIEALHTLLRDGAAHESTTDPVVLAYTLRQENKIPKARVVSRIRPTPPMEEDPEADDLAWSRAIEIIVTELTFSPLTFRDQETTAISADWGSSPVQSTVVTSTSNGIYNTPMQVYVLHSCQQNEDYYLVNTGGDWTATESRYESASEKDGQISVDSNHDLSINWQSTKVHCTGGSDVSGTILGNDERICRYMKYPLSYEVDIVPPNGPAVVQVNATPAGNQGKSASYRSGFSFSIGGVVNVSGKGPSAGIQTGVSWSNSVQTTVPPLVIHAGDIGNEGTFTQYQYCTVGSSVEDCTSTIQMVGQSGLCLNLDVGDPQNGQTPDGRLSDVAQTVNWQVNPATYVGTTFDITVTWKVNLATSTSNLWVGSFLNLPAGSDGNTGPSGYCNQFGCSCGIRTTSTTTMVVDHIFKVPFPSTQCSSNADS